MDSIAKNLLKSTATFGFALGIIVVIYNLLLYFLNIMPVGIAKPFMLFVVTVAIYFVGILMFSKQVRKEVYGGEVSYKQGLLVGILIGLFASIIISAYSYLQNVIIDPDYMNRFIDAQSQWMADYMYSKGLPDDQIETALEGLEAARDTKLSFGSYIKSVLLSALGFGVISLITSAVIRKKKTTPFAE